MAKIADLAKYLNDNKIQYQVIAHDPAFTAHDLARATHVPDSELAKAIIVRADGGFWMAVFCEKRWEQRSCISRMKRTLASSFPIARPAQCLHSGISTAFPSSLIQRSRRIRR